MENIYTMKKKDFFIPFFLMKIIYIYMRRRNSLNKNNKDESSIGAVYNFLYECETNINL